MPTAFDTIISGEIGLFGAGHLGRAVAESLVRAGFPKKRLLICHRGSAATQQALDDQGLGCCSVSPAELCARAEAILYLVRPQNAASIGELSTPALRHFVSFLAGVGLNRLQGLVQCQTLSRVMPSTPDTVASGLGLAAVYPGDDAFTTALVAAMGLRVFPVATQDDLHAFTSFGPCLPVALCQAQALGRPIERASVLRAAEQASLPGVGALFDWALAVMPKALSETALNDYVARAATPGGVTEAIVASLRQGDDLGWALLAGVARSRELDRSSE